MAGKSIIKTCPMCGKEFEAPTQRKIYCSTECIKAAERAREKLRWLSNKFTLTCVVCGKEFESHYKDRMTCSKACQYRYMTDCRIKQYKENPLTKTCPICGKEFQTTERQTKYCSKECAYEALKRADKIKRERTKVIETGVPYVYYDGGANGTRAICPVCGKEFVYTYEWVYKRSGAYFCSWTCYRANDKKKGRSKA